MTAVAPILLLLLMQAPISAAAQGAVDATEQDQQQSESQVFAREARFEAGAFIAIRGWKTAYRKTDTVFTYGAIGAWMPLHWLGIAGSVEHARRASSPEDLRIRNTETLMAAGPRLSLWINFLRFFVDLHGVAIIRTVNYRDVDELSSTRMSAGVSVGPGFTVAVAERLGVTVRVDWRRRDDQSHMLGSLDVSWLFQ